MQTSAKIHQKFAKLCKNKPFFAYKTVALLENDQNLFDCIFHLQTISLTNVSYAFKYSFEDLVEQLKQKIVTSYDFHEENGKKSVSKSNLYSLIESEYVCKTFNEDMQKQTELHLKFWAELSNSEPNKNELISLSETIENDYNKLRTKWDKLITANDKCDPKLFLHYGIFTLIVKNKMLLAEELIKTSTIN